MKKNKKIYGRELILDLKECDLKIISSKEKILKYLEQLCRLIKMKRYGNPIVKRFGFGKDYSAGYSMVQLIETSSITGHFSELWRSVYINIFSCKLFDTQKAREFTKRFFKAKTVKNRVFIR